MVCICGDDFVLARTVCENTGYEKIPQIIET